MPSNFKALAGASGGEPIDANFKNVTLLLHGDGSNGAQNSTFLDSSTNNFTITRNGNATQGSFSPYGSNWSNYFDGSSTLTFSQINMAGDFTIECWVYYTGTGDGTVLGALPPNHQSLRRLSNKHYFYREGVSVSGTIDLPVNQWVHLAATRSGSTVRIFTNGVLDGSVTVTGTFSLNCLGGINTTTDRLTGYASNVRIVNGTALYTSTFTPPTAPLTAITNTSLLTCQSNRFLDNSTNNFAITRNGNVKVTNFAPFAPSSAYSTTTNGGSGYFDGTGDYLVVPSNTAFAYGTGDFTVETWVYKSASGIMAVMDYTGSGGFGFIVNDTQIFAYQSVGPSFTFTYTLALNTWAHIALVRTGGNLVCYANGALVGSLACTNNFTSPSDLNIGRNPGANTYFWNGYISNLRIVKGTAVYTANFTPPTSPVTAITNTSLLLNATNAAIFDNSMKNDLETVGNAQISTSVKKFGTGSMYFDGSGDYLITPDTLTGNFGTGDFTVEFWWYGGAQPARYPCQVGTLDAFSATGAWRVTTYNDNANNFAFIDGITTYSFAATNYNDSAWHHIAVTRSGTTVRGFVDGVQIGSSATVSTSFTARKTITGGQFRDNGFIQGYIDDLRITKGVARYTANFTAPTAPFTNK